MAMPSVLAAPATVNTPGGDKDDKDAFPIASTPLGQINAHAVDLTGLSVPRGLLGQQPADAPAALGYLRNVLLLESTTAAVKDQVWRHIAQTARTRGPRQADWNLFALGVAYPGLRKRARKLTPPPTPFGRVKDVHFELAVEFLLALHRLDLHTPNVISRLMGAAYDQASGRKKPKDQPREVDVALVDPDELHQALERGEVTAYTGPDTEPHEMLNQLVHRSAQPDHHGPTLTEQHAALIARTYLDGHPLGDVAADLDLSLPTASKRRRRGAGIIARLLGRADLADQ